MKRMLSLCLAAILCALCGCAAPAATAPSPTATAASSTAAVSTGTPDAAGSPPAENETPTVTGPLVDESEYVTFKAMRSARPQHPDLNTMPFFVQMCQEHNVGFELEVLSDSNSTEVKNLSLATGDLPDIYLGSLLSVSDIQNNPDFFVAYTDEMLAVMPNTQHIFEIDPEVKKYLTLGDGKIYGMVNWLYLENEMFQPQLFMNKTWLDQLGLEVPNTIEEFETCLRGFRDNDCNGNGDPTDEIPYTFIVNMNYFAFNQMYACFGDYDTASTSDGARLRYHDGKVTFTANEDGWKDATKWYHKLYDEGLLDPEGFTQDRSTLFSKGKAETMTIGTCSAFLMQNVVGADRYYEHYTYVLPLEKVDGSGERVSIFTYNPNASRTCSVITTACDPDQILRLCYFMDAWLTEDASLQSCYGQFGTYIDRHSDPSSGYDISSMIRRMAKAPTNTVSPTPGRALAAIFPRRC